MEGQPNAQGFLDKLLSQAQQYHKTKLGLQDSRNVADTLTLQTYQTGKTENLNGSGQVKTFIIKKGERNESLRNYLRKSLDPHGGANNHKAPIAKHPPSKSGEESVVPKKRREHSKVIGLNQMFQNHSGLQ